MPALSDQDKERVRYHLGYLDTSFAASIQMGIPQPLQTMFLLEDAMNLLASTYAVQRVQRMLETLDKIECLMSGQALQTLAAEQIGNMKLHPLAAKHGKTYPDSLEREYARWGKRLADVLGVIPYPYSDRYSQGKGPGNSLSVRN